MITCQTSSQLLLQAELTQCRSGHEKAKTKGRLIRNKDEIKTEGRIFFAVAEWTQDEKRKYFQIYLYIDHNDPLLI